MKTPSKIPASPSPSEVRGEAPTVPKPRRRGLVIYKPVETKPGKESQDALATSPVLPPEGENIASAIRLSKQDIVLSLLRRPNGVTVDEISMATDWQRHSVRGFLSGTVKKKLGLTVSSVASDRGRVYRLGEGA